MKSLLLSSLAFVTTMVAGTVAHADPVDSWFYVCFNSEQVKNVLPLLDKTSGNGAAVPSFKCAAGTTAHQIRGYKREKQNCTPPMTALCVRWSLPKGTGFQAGTGGDGCLTLAGKYNYAGECYTEGKM